MNKNFDVLNKAMDLVKKSQDNFVNGDGKDNQDSIHSQKLGNENGSISRTGSATGEGDDPVDSSNSTKKNPVGQEGRGVHSPGTRTHGASSVKDPVDTSGDGHADDPENKSVNTKDVDKDKNGAREPDTQLHNNTRKLSDKPNGNAKAENHMTDNAAGTKHNTAELATASIDKLIDVTKNLIHDVNINSGHINALKSEFLPIRDSVKELKKSLDEPEIKRNTTDKSAEVDAMTGANKNEQKHMAPAQIRGMFGHAEHAHGKKKTHEMAEADNAVTRCHNSHKSITDDQWRAIESKAYVQAAKSIINQVGDDNLAKSLDSKLEHDAETGNKQALGKDNYKYDQREKAAHAKKSVNNGSAAASTNSSASKSLSLADCMSMLASAKKAGNTSLVAKCSKMCQNMKAGSAAKSEAANLKKTIDNVDHKSSANVSNLSANSQQKPNNASDDINHSTKSEASSTEKSMPHGKAIGATPDKSNSKNSSSNNDLVHKSLVNPTILKNQAKLYKSVFTQRSKHMIGSEPMVHKSMNLLHEAVENNDPSYLRKSINNFNALLKK